MKCTACTAFKCKGAYKLRNFCTGEKEGIKCVCKCHVTALKYVLTTGCSIVGGAAMMIGKKVILFAKSILPFNF
mgnify:CR=1 FL=1